MTKKEERAANKKLIGIILQTRDEFFEGRGDFAKEGHENKKDLYRKVVVVAAHKGNLAVVKTNGKPKNPDSKRVELPDEKGSYYKKNLYVETKDVNKQSITFGKLFVPKGKDRRVSKRDVVVLQKVAFKGKGRRAKENRRKVRKMKGRK